MNISFIKKKTPLYFIFIAIFNLITYFPSFYHIPRSDHLVYLANIAHQKGWLTLALGNYALNRTLTPFNDLADQLLFRPVTYIILGTEKWLFDYHFIYWQITGFILHLIVLWFLLKILMEIHESIFAVLFVLFFSVLHAGNEMVIWHHVNSYLVFLACIFYSLNQVQKIIRKKEVSTPQRFKILICLLAASFTHETGIVFSILLGAYLYWDYPRQPFDKNFALIKNFSITLILYPLLSYLILNLTDFKSRGLNFLSQGGIENTKILIFPLIKKIYSTIYWWIYVGLFPTELELYPIQRTIIHPLYIYYGKPLLNLGHSSVWISLAAIIGYILVVFKNISFSFLKKQVKFIVLGVSMLLSYAVMIVLARVNLRGIVSTLGDNAYYNYFFWAFLIIFIYALIPFQNLKTTPQLKHLKLIFIALSFFSISIHGYLSHQLMKQKADADFLPLELSNIADQLIKRYSLRPDFSMGIAPKFLKTTRYFDWIKNYQTHKQGFHFIELLYPQYYVEKYPKFLFYINKEGKWDYWIRKDP